MTEIYFQKMTPEGYHEIELQIEELKKERPTKIARLKAAERSVTFPKTLNIAPPNAICGISKVVFAT